MLAKSMVAFTKGILKKINQTTDDVTQSTGVRPSTTTDSVPPNPDQSIGMVTDTKRIPKMSNKQSKNLKQSWSTIFVYVLQLENDKYYIGKSHNPDERIRAHRKGRGVAWTKRYRVIRMMEQRPLLQDRNIRNDVETITLEYMQRYGIENVRGGPWTRSTLTLSDKRTIASKIDDSFDVGYGTCQPLLIMNIVDFLLCEENCFQRS
jgi:predicted GIY-YIG superfamily endonuclease